MAINKLAGLEKFFWRASVVFLVLLIGSMFFGFHYAKGWDGFSMGQGELQVAMQMESWAYSYSTRPPQGWSFFTVTPKLYWEPELNEMFGIGYLRLPLWIPFVAMLVPALLLKWLAAKRKS